MMRMRVAIGVAGAALIGVGGVFLVIALRPDQIAGLLVWLAAAVVLHDAVLVPVVTAVDLLLRRAARRVPAVVVTVIEAGFAVGALLTAMVIPELIAQARGARNATVLPGDYGVRLAVLWIAIVIAVSVASCVIVWRARRSGRRS